MGAWALTAGVGFTLGVLLLGAGTALASPPTWAVPAPEVVGKWKDADGARAAAAVLSAVIAQDDIEALSTADWKAVAGADAAKKAEKCDKGSPDARGECLAKAFSGTSIAGAVVARVDGPDGLRVRMKAYRFDGGELRKSTDVDEKFAQLAALISGRSALRAKVAAMIAPLLESAGAGAAAAEEGAAAEGESRRRRKGGAKAEEDEPPARKRAARDEEDDDDPPPRKGGKRAAKDEDEDEPPARKSAGRGRRSAADTKAIVVDAYKLYQQGRLAAAISKLEDAQTEPCRCDEDNRVNALLRDVRAVDEGLKSVREGVDAGNGPAAVKGGEQAREALAALSEFGAEIGVSGEAQSGRDLDRQLARAYVLTGEGFARENQYLKAIDQWERALKLDPDNADAKDRLSRKTAYAQKCVTLAREERDLEPAKARALAEQAIKLVPDANDRVHQQAQDLLDELEED